MNIEEVRKLALSFPETYEQEHFGIPSFRVRNKIFSTLRETENRVMVKLSPEDQSVFCAIDSAHFQPVPGGWGAKGATLVDLETVGSEIFCDALTTAFRLAAPKSLSRKMLVENK